MKKIFIKEMTSGKRDSLVISNKIITMYENIEPSQLSQFLTHNSMTNYIAAYVGYGIGRDLGGSIISELMGD